MTKQKCCKQLPFIVIAVVLFLAGLLLFQNRRSASPSPQWLTYSSSKNNFSIDYPKGWTVEEGNYNLVSFSVSSGSYKLQYYAPSALTRICVFDDTDAASLKTDLERDYPGYFDQSNVQLNDYTEFGNYRRSTSEGKVIVCKGWQETGFEYILPSNPDQRIVSQMDKMVQSMTRYGQPDSL